MDDEISRLREELSKMLRKAAELKVRLDRPEGKVRGASHDPVIEEAAETEALSLAAPVPKNFCDS
jgi:hypothetical protein